MSGNNKVGVCSDSAVYSDAVGFACYDASDGEQVAVAGPGNIVWCCLDTTVSAGTLVYGDEYGILDETAGNASKVAGIVVKAGTTGTTNYPGQVLVL
jgi:hypothetical protein